MTLSFEDKKELALNIAAIIALIIIYIIFVKFVLKFNKSKTKNDEPDRKMSFYMIGLLFIAMAFPISYFILSIVIIFETDNKAKQKLLDNRQILMFVISSIFGMIAAIGTGGTFIGQGKSKSKGKGQNKFY